ncbi:hypothetical protein DKX38_022187 [Salix brachista]|uniref:Uncharacterized protein n=1 Tax=Salix brachista TaxID=2182728 RepID=A0A5N5JYZ2_9ROSI|nr:hypothetical protein DKX38_022187 [Salix brachista]
MYSSKVKRRFLSLRIHLDVDGAGYDGRYSEGESRYNLSNNIIKVAALEYHAIAIKSSLHPVSLSIVDKFGILLLPNQICISFVLRHPLVASAIFGATKSWQLQEVLKACNFSLIDSALPIGKILIASVIWNAPPSMHFLVNFLFTFNTKEIACNHANG